jgi:hypothetical protein
VPVSPAEWSISMATTTDVRQVLDKHGRSIDELHRELSAVPGADKERLAAAVSKYKTAHKQFEDDALGCMN